MYDVKSPGNGRRLMMTAASLAAAALVLAGCSSGAGSASPSAQSTAGGSDRTVVVGVLASTTGYLAAEDNAMVDGAQLAVAKANSDRLAGSAKLKLDIVNIASSAPNATTMLEQLVTSDNVGAVINGYLSASVTAVAPKLTSNKLPLVATAVIPPNVSWAFTVTPPVQSWVDMQVQYLKDVVHASKVGLVYSQTPYGQQISNALNNAAKRSGITVVKAEGAPATATDLTPQLTSIKSAGSEAIVDGLFGAQHLVLAKNAASINLTVPIVGGPDSDSIYEQATAQYDKYAYIAFPTQLSPDQIASSAQRAATSEFLDAWNAESHSPDVPIFAGGQGWDAVMVLAAGLKASNGATGDALRSALQHVDLQSATTRFTYTPQDHSGQQGRPLSQVPWTVVHNAGGTLTILYPKTSK